MPGLSSIRNVANAMDRAGPPGTDLVHLNTKELAALVRAGFPARRAADGTLAFPDAPADAVARAGVRGDTEVAHAGPQARRALKAAGGAGVPNPRTGRPSYFGGGDKDDSGKDRGSNDSGGGSSADNGRDSVGSDAETGGKGGNSGGRDSGRGDGGGPEDMGGSRNDGLSLGERAAERARRDKPSPNARSRSDGPSLTELMSRARSPNTMLSEPEYEAYTSGGPIGVEAIGLQEADIEENSVVQDALTGVLGLSERLDPEGALLGQTDASWGFDLGSAAIGLVGTAFGIPGLGMLAGWANRNEDLFDHLDLGPDVFGGVGPETPSGETGQTGKSGAASHTDDTGRDGRPRADDAPPSTLATSEDDPADKTAEARAYFLPSYVRPDTMQENDAMAWTGPPSKRGLSGIVSAQGRYGDTEAAHLSAAAQDALRWLGGAGTRNPVTGKREYFDADWYREQNPDVAEAGVDPLQHYQQYGRAEGRAAQATPSGFDADAYRTANKDVADAGVDPYSHWVEYGRAEGRPIHAPRTGPGSATGPDFEKDYLAANTDVADAVKGGQFKSGVEHYLIHGIDEGRATAPTPEPEPDDPPDFDTIFQDAIADIQDYYTKYIDGLFKIPRQKQDTDPDTDSNGTPTDVSSGFVSSTPRYRAGRYRGTRALGF